MSILSKAKSFLKTALIVTAAIAFLPITIILLCYYAYQMDRGMKYAWMEQNIYDKLEACRNSPEDIFEAFGNSTPTKIPEAVSRHVLSNFFCSCLNTKDIASLASETRKALKNVIKNEKKKKAPRQHLPVPDVYRGRQIGGCTYNDPERWHGPDTRRY